MQIFKKGFYNYSYPLPGIFCEQTKLDTLECFVACENVLAFFHKLWWSLSSSQYFKKIVNSSLKAWKIWRVWDIFNSQFLIYFTLNLTWFYFKINISQSLHYFLIMGIVFFLYHLKKYVLDLSCSYNISMQEGEDTSTCFSSILCKNFSHFLNSDLITFWGGNVHTMYDSLIILQWELSTAPLPAGLKASYAGGCVGLSSFPAPSKCSICICWIDLKIMEPGNKTSWLALTNAAFSENQFDLKS